jgi:Tfp pilus assembly protein PilP
LASAVQEVIYKDERPLKKLFETQKEAGKKETSTEEVEKEGRYIYDPTDKTDPFKSFIARQEEVQETIKRKPKTYLETLDLSQLELIAIIVGPKGSWAMVRESKGTGHVIKKGTPIGTRSGVVHKITDEEVTIREEYKDFKGRIKYKDVVKKVPSLH